MNHFSFFSGILAQQPASPQPGGLGPLLWMLLLFGGMWFLLIAPQRKLQKQHKKMLSELKAGDRVLTKGGIYAKIVSVKEDRLVVKIGEGTNIEIAKDGVANLVSG